MNPIIVEYKGEKHTLKEWSEISGICYSTLHRRYSKGVDLLAPTVKPKVDKTSPEWKAHWAEYMRKYRADPMNRLRILDQQSVCYYKHREARLEYKRKKDAERRLAKTQNKAN